MNHRENPRKAEIPRRSFLKSTAAITVLAAPYYVPASVFGQAAPSNRINVACIGTGNQGFLDLRNFMIHDDCQLVAVCDVNPGSDGYKEKGDVRGREPAKRLVEDHYANQHSVGKYKGCDAYSDFREVLSRKDIDAVIIVLPDHWHEYVTIAAARAGKDIYCEKPLGLTIAAQRRMVDEVRKHGRVLQTGSHERSNAKVQKACDLVRSGAIGDVKRVVCHVGRNNKVAPGPGWQPMPVPEGFDYERWLGPAPEAPYHEDRCLYNFRFNYDYSGGQVTNFGAHSLDMAQWGLGADKTGPVEVAYTSAEYLPEGSLFNTATYTQFSCKYANGTVLDCFTASPSVRCIFFGTEGVISVDSGGSPSFVTPSKLAEEFRAVKGGKKAEHARNFLDCVKSRNDPVAPVEVGHRSASVCHLGNIAIKLKAKKLQWDPDAEKFVGRQSEDANSLLDRPARGDWHA